jgi:hypothetical protein
MERQEQTIIRLTKNFLNQVEVSKGRKDEVEKIRKMFSADGVLIGTMSKMIRTENDINDYFEWFTKLPKLKIKEAKYNIVKVTDDVYINNAFVQWNMDKQQPVKARMTFIFRKNKIVELHSSKLPKPPKELKED